MSILEEFVETRWVNGNKAHYEALGYEYTGYRTILRVLSTHLTPTSSVRINAVCAHCGKSRSIDRSDYSELCRHCAAKDQQRCTKISEAHIRRCADPEERKRKSEAGKLVWTDERRAWFSGYMKNLLKNPDVRRRYSVKSWKRFCGPTNPKWNASLTDADRQRTRNYPEYFAWRKAVYERDNFTCQCCGQRGGQLNAHHVFNFRDYPELATVKENGTTLCKAHHDDFHRRYGKRRNTRGQYEAFIASFRLSASEA